MERGKKRPRFGLPIAKTPNSKAVVANVARKTKGKTDRSKLKKNKFRNRKKN